MINLANILTVVGGSIVGYYAFKEKNYIKVIDDTTGEIHIVEEKPIKEDKNYTYYKRKDDGVVIAIAKVKSIDDMGADELYDTQIEKEQAKIDAYVEDAPTDSTDKEMYLGHKDKPYDPFYDYSGTQFIDRADMLASILSAPNEVLRARVIPELTFMSLRDDEPTLFMYDQNGKFLLPKDERERLSLTAKGTRVNEQSTRLKILGEQGIAERVVFKGKCVDIRTTIEIYNPTKENIPLTTIEVLEVRLNNRTMRTIQFDEVDVDAIAYRDKVGGVSLPNKISSIWADGVYDVIEKKHRVVYKVNSEDETIKTVPAYGSLFVTINLKSLYKQNDLQLLKRKVTIEPVGFYNLSGLLYEITPTEYGVDYPNGGLELKIGISNDSYLKGQLGALNMSLYQGNRPKVESLKSQYQKQYIGYHFQQLFSPKDYGIDDQYNAMKNQGIEDLFAKYFDTDNAKLNYINMVKAETDLHIVDKTLSWDAYIKNVATYWAEWAKKRKEWDEKVYQAYRRIVFVWSGLMKNMNLATAKKLLSTAKDDIGAIPESYQFWAGDNVFKNTTISDDTAYSDDEDIL